MMETRKRRGLSGYKHGHRGSNFTSPTWISWRAMNERCYTVGASDYPRYGGRGIHVCDRWRISFLAFLHDMGERPAGKTLDRKDVNGDYEVSNCRWATAKQQAENRRGTTLLTFRGQTQTISTWAKQVGLDKGTIKARLAKSWSVDRALTTPPMSREERGILGLISRGVLDADETR